MSRKVRRMLRLFALSIGAILIWQGFSYSKFPEQYSGSVVYLIGLMIMSQVAWVFYAIRFQTSLKVFGYDMPFKSAYLVHIQSIFYLFFVPFGVGMDLAKYFKLSGRNVEVDRSKQRIVVALLFDRATGFGISVLIGLAALSIAGGGYELHADRSSIYFLIAAFLAVLAIVWIYRQQILVLAHDAMKMLCEKPVLALVLAGATLGMLAVLAACLLVGAELAGIGLGIPLAFAAVTIALILQALPISFAGIGGGEVGAAGLYLASGYSYEQALTLVGVFYCFRLTAAIIGGVAEAGHALSVRI